MHYKSIYREGLFSSLLVVITGGEVDTLAFDIREEAVVQESVASIEWAHHGIRVNAVAPGIITGTTLRVDGGTPNTHPGYAILDHNRSEPFQGFHRSTVPAMLQTRQNQAAM